ncbi:MAG: hypothetical protein OXE84_07185 [Rhodobacteraceae bacterium]|nr:hypothetical protein [Paracoccaceae bacterium]MCY4197134.1 hypothetical protein [Paracoccaceae bacterium]MCY4328120.1 hypothetical protein [Paracoccaceae bacterium]
MIALLETNVLYRSKNASGDLILKHYDDAVHSLTMELILPINQFRQWLEERH